MLFYRSQASGGLEADQVRQSYPIKSSMKSSTSQPYSSVNFQNYYVPPSPSPPLPPPPSPPPTLPARTSSAVGPLSQSMTNDLEFPAPPSAIGKPRETITRQALTEPVVVRETNSGRFSVAVEVIVYLYSALTKLKVSCSLSPGCRRTQRHWRALGVAHCRWQGFVLHSIRDAG